MLLRELDADLGRQVALCDGLLTEIRLGLTFLLLSAKADRGPGTDKGACHGQS
jgi:hypothetical protein